MNLYFYLHVSGPCKNTQTKKNNTVCNKFLHPTHHPATCLIQYSQFLQLTTYEYKPNVKPMVIWVLGTRDLGYFKCKSILSVSTKCLFIWSNSSLWKHPMSILICQEWYELNTVISERIKNNDNLLQISVHI